MKCIEIKINAKLYSEKDIFRVIDILSNEYKIKFNDRVDDFYILEIHSVNGENTSSTIETLFFEHLNNQKIRDIIYNETHVVREMIISKALFETEAYDDNTDYFDIAEYEKKDNYILDPYEIALPYDDNNEKNGTE